MCDVFFSFFFFPLLLFLFRLYFSPSLCDLHLAKFRWETGLRISSPGLPASRPRRFAVFQADSELALLRPSGLRIYPFSQKTTSARSYIPLIFVLGECFAFLFPDMTKSHSEAEGGGTEFKRADLRPIHFFISSKSNSLFPFFFLVSLVSFVLFF